MESLFENTKKQKFPMSPVKMQKSIDHVQSFSLQLFNNCVSASTDLFSIV